MRQVLNSRKNDTHFKLSVWRHLEGEKGVLVSNYRVEATSITAKKIVIGGGHELCNQSI